MSDYVVHFTKPPAVPEPRSPLPPPEREGRLTRTEFYERVRRVREEDRSGYYPMLDILGEGCLRPGPKPLGAARKIGALGRSQHVVCFSEIPLDMLDRLVERRSLYGIGFRKDVIVEKGGAPLWYLDKEGVQAGAVQRIIEDKVRSGVDPDDPFWKLTPFIDHPGVYKGRPYRFEWEREWRVAGEVPFEPDDVAFLFIPEDLHDRARQFFADAKVEHSGPSYDCAYIDPRWDMEKIQGALEDVPDPPGPSAHAVPWYFGSA